MRRHCACDRVEKGTPFVAGRDCARCWNYWHRRAFHLAQGGTAATLLADPGPCRCGDCAGCSPPAGVPPLSLVRITAADLGHPAGDAVSNASVVRYRGRLLLAYRHLTSGADVWVRELRDDLTPAAGPSVRLALDHPAARFGREDPRWFVFGGRPHVCFAGVQGERGPTQVLYARLRDDLSTEAVFAPPSPTGSRWEKNWGFFEGPDGDLYAVYTIRPHVVLRVDEDRVRPMVETPNPFPWSGGLLRGGASPVRVGDRYVSWFHGRRKYGGRLTYTTGVYTFAARPPFAPLAMTPHPVKVGDAATRPADWYCDNWFPCGAVCERGEWLVSAGAHDRWVELARWPGGVTP